jgi:hypothetical protein
MALMSCLSAHNPVARFVVDVCVRAMAPHGPETDR